MVTCSNCLITGADPVFLERGFRCVKEGVGFAMLILSQKFLNIP